MDRRTALEFVERIEAHRVKEAAIWQEMRQRDDYGAHDYKAIEDILEARESAKALIDEAKTGLDAFDWVDDGTGNFVPREEVDA